MKEILPSFVAWALCYVWSWWASKYDMFWLFGVSMHWYQTMLVALFSPFTIPLSTVFWILHALVPHWQTPLIILK